MPSSRASQIVSSRLEETIGASTRQRQRRSRHGGSRAAARPRRGCAPGSSSPASAGRASPIPAPARICGITVHQAEAAGQQRETADAAGDQQAAGHRPRLGVAPDPRGRDRRDRQHADRERRGERLDAPAGDEQEDHQEDDRGERRREQPQGDRGPQRRARGGGLGRRRLLARRDRTGPERGAEGHQPTRRGERHLGEEDRPPVEGLGQRAAERGSDRDPEHRRRHPEPPPAARAAAVEQTEGGDQRRGAPTACTPRRTRSRPSESERPQASEAARTGRSRRRRAARRRSGARGAAAGMTAIARTAV